MTTCEIYLPKLDAYVDGELSTAELEELETHLKSCAACSSLALSRMQQKRITHRAGKKFVSSPEFRARIKKQIPKQFPQQIPQWIPTIAGVPWKWATALAAAAVVLIVAGLLIQTQ